jgi:hypothetical protein
MIDSLLIHSEKCVDQAESMIVIALNLQTGKRNDAWN